MAKITLIGTGMIGQNLAQLIILRQMANDLVLLDIDTRKAVGAMMDITQAGAMDLRDIHYCCTTDYADIKGSDIIIITAGVTGLAPGQDAKTWNRDTMLNSNVKIIAQIAEKVKQHAPNAFVIVVTNPMDIIVSLFQRLSDFAPHKVVGEAGTDDTRFRHFCAVELDVSVRDVTGFVVGEHGDSMVPLFSTVTKAGLPVAFSEEQKITITEATVFGGKKVIDICGISPYRTVSAAILDTVDAYLGNRNRVLAISNYDKEKGFYYAWPCIINKKGVSKRVAAMDALTAEERTAFESSLAKIKTDLAKAEKILKTR